MNVKIRLKDGTELPNVKLFKEQKLADTIIDSTEEIIEYLDAENNEMVFFSSLFYTRLHYT